MEYRSHPIPWQSFNLHLQTLVDLFGRQLLVILQSYPWKHCYIPFSCYQGFNAVHLSILGVID